MKKAPGRSREKDIEHVGTGEPQVVQLVHFLRDLLAGEGYTALRPKVAHGRRAALWRRATWTSRA